MATFERRLLALGFPEARAFDGMRAELARFFAPFNAALVAELGSSWGDDEAPLLAEALAYAVAHCTPSAKDQQHMSSSAAAPLLPLLFHSTAADSPLAQLPLH